MNNPYRLLGTRVVFEDRFMVVHEDRVGLPSGAEAPFSWLSILPGALILALTVAREVYLVREYKYGIRMASLELIGGAIDPGEEPIDAAKRELKEEANISARTWTALGSMHPLPSFLDCANHLFLAEDVYETPHPPQANEVLELVRMPLEDAVDRVLTNEIHHAPSCALILRVAELLRLR